MSLCLGFILTMIMITAVYSLGIQYKPKHSNSGWSVRNKDEEGRPTTATMLLPVAAAAVEL